MNLYTHIHTQVISVNFICNFYQRTATITLPEGVDELIRVRPLWTDGLNNILHERNGNLANLRWFASGNNPVPQMDVKTLPVELQYTSKQLDREIKLETLGVK